MTQYNKMLGFIKKSFYRILAFLSTLTRANLLSCISMNNRKCKVRPQIVNVNGNEPVFFPFSIKTSKCSGSCNNINNPYAKLCVLDVLKNGNVRAFNLMPRLMKQDTQNGMKLVNVSVDQMQAFVIINNPGMMIHASVNVRN